MAKLSAGTEVFVIAASGDVVRIDSIFSIILEDEHCDIGLWFDPEKNSDRSIFCIGGYDNEIDVAIGFSDGEDHPSISLSYDKNFYLPKNRSWIAFSGKVSTMIVFENNCPVVGKVMISFNNKSIFPKKGNASPIDDAESGNEHR